MERWDRIGRYAAYGAALALTPYLLIKVSWVIGALLGVLPVGKGFSTAGWVLLNTVTVGMAAIGIALALALVRPWGMRIPGRLVAFCAWIGSGFLVSILPYAVLSTVLDAARDGSGGGGGGDPAMPGWEAALVQFSFVGMGLGLAVALPAYLRRRWPRAFAGRDAGGSTRATEAAVAVSAVVGLVWVYWAAGGTLGISHPASQDTDGRLLCGVGAFWALAGAAAVRLLTRPRPAALPRPVLLATAWLGSGSLFAWCGWKLPLTLAVALAHSADGPPENPAVAAVLYLAAVLAGATMLRTIVGARAQPEFGCSAPADAR
ncbi:hypothetical protein LXH13_16095 [Streptomyces spinosirectus]|uniref:hypothetical protein n=1 Tax=Streptomyces TaxID=1883 RepID=UPI000D3B1BB0|nr:MULTISPECIES: hypothetical protein [Streptomyces]MBY8340424.1 hypothetical protein [Streptomyces plumbidurans]PTM92356.1 hypothetical protein C7821_109177 [Streptomyces sp. VMFN-G11Ma]UIR18475.1 hypothetical protein LXH13_16095 [Streptomyces spinosirectus]